MKHYKQINPILLYILIIWMVGCSSLTTEKSNTFITEAVSTQSTTSFSANQFQLTYIQNHDNSGELYISDVNCMTQDKACFGEPKLSFATLTMPNSDENKPRGLLTDYSWSPDGTRIALTSTGDILIGDIKAQSWVNITNSSDVDEYQPKWSSDGNSIYYRACQRTTEGNYGGHGACRLYRARLTGEVQFNLLNSRIDYYNSYDVSPDGQQVAYTLTDNQGYDQIYLADINDSDGRQITEGPMNNITPSFSPDGKKILFVRLNESEGVNSLLQSDLVMKDLDTGEEKNLTQEFEGDVFSPALSPDGKWVAFTSFDKELNSNIFVASLGQSVVIQATHGNQDAVPSWRLSLKQ
ncbi:MAG: PD40 domain-containing protein [Anaerolineae bacterium]|nr:PD40 domain-containing protein [Anaerolineae bacterium]